MNEIEVLHDKYLEQAVIGAALVFKEIADEVRLLPDDFFWDFYANALALGLKNTEGNELALVLDEALKIKTGIDRRNLFQFGMTGQTNALSPHGTREGIVQLGEYRTRRKWFAYATSLREKTLANEPLDIEPPSHPDTTVSTKAFVPTPLDLTEAPEVFPELVPGLYAGMATTLQSPSGYGKSWLALYWALKVMETGGKVAYFDEEMGKGIVHARLRLLGADADLVTERFMYFPFESRSWDSDDVSSLRDVAGIDGLSLVVFDSLSDFLVQGGFDENSSNDFIAFFERVIGQFRRRDIATLTLDHLNKETEEPGSANKRHARGSSAKLARDDATLRLRAERMFDSATPGKLHLSKTKDRVGQLSVPMVGDGSIPIYVQTYDDAITFRFGEREGYDQRVAKVKRAVTRYFREQSRETKVPESTLMNVVGDARIDRDVMREALQQLKVEGTVTPQLHHGRPAWSKGGQLLMDDYNRSMDS